MTATAEAVLQSSVSEKRSAKITSKGQITLPVEIRRALGVGTGDQVVFERGPDGQMYVRKLDPFPFERFRGMGTGIPELEAGPESIVKYFREMRGHDEVDHID